MGNINRLLYTYPEPEYEELFRPITYPGIKQGSYLISNHGRVYNIKHKIFMKTYFDDDDHEKITLSTDVKHPTKRGNKQKHYFIHRLMAWQFIGPPLDELHNVINHKNGIPCCNLIHNLEWASVLENTNHAKKLGLMNTRGINSKSSVYDEKVVRKICSYFEDGYNTHEVLELITQSKKYKKYTRKGLQYIINKLWKRITYRDIVTDYDYLPPLSIFKCDKYTQKIRELISQNKNNYEIMHEFGFSDINDDRRLYMKIINERTICEVLFNDYRNIDLEKVCTGQK